MPVKALSRKRPAAAPRKHPKTLPRVLPKLTIRDLGWTREQAREVRAKLDKNFNIGKAIEKNVYASNVVKVAEAFGTGGYTRLMSRVDPEVVKGLGLDARKPGPTRSRRRSPAAGLSARCSSSIAKC